MGARRLTLLRHGKAQGIDTCAEDFERSLTKRGDIEAHETAARLVERNLIPDLILVSPAERAWATAEIVAEVCELDPKQVQAARELYLASPETTWRLLTSRDRLPDHVLICGHNPGLSEIASRFGPRPRLRELSTAGYVSAVWHGAEWNSMQPETAAECDMDEPDVLDPDARVE